MHSGKRKVVDVHMSILYVWMCRRQQIVWSNIGVYVCVYVCLIIFFHDHLHVFVKLDYDYSCKLFASNARNIQLDCTVTADFKFSFYVFIILFSIVFLSLCIPFIIIVIFNHLICHTFFCRFICLFCCFFFLVILHHVFFSHLEYIL